MIHSCGRKLEILLNSLLTRETRIPQSALIKYPLLCADPPVLDTMLEVEDAVESDTVLALV